MRLGLGSEAGKSEVFSKVGAELESLAIGVVGTDETRPWGGFFVINPSSTDRFIELFFPDHNINEIKKYGDQLSPKILVVAPSEQLSWQYHHRRAELWRCIVGPVGYKRSLDDDQGHAETLEEGSSIQFNPSERHRLIGLENWGIVAEFWQHTDPNHPSDEDDIVRLSDNYGR